MTATPTSRRGPRAPESGAPVLPQDPPPWIARAVAWLLLALFATAVAAAFLVRVPETIEVPFVLQSAGSVPGGAPVKLDAQMTFSRKDARRIDAGARVRLHFDDFPAERFGSVPAHVEPGAPLYRVEGDVSRPARLDETTIGIGDARRSLLQGMKGTARVVVGDRSVAEALFFPRR